MNEHEHPSELPHATVAFGAVELAEQMASSSDHNPSNAKSAQCGLTPTASAEESVRPPREAENLPSVSVAQTIAQQLAGKE